MPDKEAPKTPPKGPETVPELKSVTSNDVGKQTKTKADKK